MLPLFTSGIYPSNTNLPVQGATYPYRDNIIKSISHYQRNKEETNPADVGDLTLGH